MHLSHFPYCKYLLLLFIFLCTSDHGKQFRYGPNTTLEQWDAKLAKHVFDEICLSNRLQIYSRQNATGGAVELFFSPSQLVAAIGSRGDVLQGSFQALALFLTPIFVCEGKVHYESGRMWEEATGACGVWEEFCEEVTEG